VKHTSSPTLRVLILAAVAACAPLCHAAFDAYLKLDGIEGESQEPAHPGWIDLLAFTTGVARNTNDAPSWNDFSLAKPLDNASPLLFQHCASGKHVPEAIVEVVRTSPSKQRYYRFVFEDVLVTSYQTSAASDAIPTEQFSLNFQKLTWTYTEFDASDDQFTGHHRAYWDLLRNEGALVEVPPFRVAGSQPQPDTLVLSWPAEAGRTYSIKTASDLSASFAELQQVIVASDGTTTLNVPLIGPHRFFLVEEQP
jgi:type VI secretion system secreted protein Hcp